MPNVQTGTWYEQLQLREPDVDDGLTPLGVPGFAGLFLSLLEDPDHRGGPWTVSIAPSILGDVVIVARRGDVELRRQGHPVEASIEVFKAAMAQPTPAAAIAA
jgi:hypothetical protein